MKRLRWKKNPEEKGLFRIGAGPRGSVYHDGEKQYASVSASGGDWRKPLAGWYWVAGWDSGIPYKNTCNELCPTEAEAKKQAEKQHI